MWKIILFNRQIKRYTDFQSPGLSSNHTGNTMCYARQQVHLDKFIYIN